LPIDPAHLLEHLVGSELAAVGRAASLQHFTFRVAGGEEVFLHTESPWRLTDASGIVSGRSDYWRPASPEVSDEALDAGELGCTLRDVRNATMRETMSKRAIVVTSAVRDRIGGLVIEFGDELRLEIFPDASPVVHDSWEFWRLFQRDQPHFVVGTDGQDIHG